MKFCRGKLLFTSGPLLGAFLLALPALAAEGAQANPADSTGGAIFRWLNFAIVVGGTAYLYAKYGRGYFSANARAISASIREGTAAKEEADRRLQEVDARIARLDQEIDELREAARRDTAAEAARLNASGQAEMEKIRQAARGELEATERAARQELRALAAAMAVERAGGLIGARMNPNLRARLFQAFLGELGRSAN